MPALPVFAGTRPYQIVPFQWSAHILSADGQVRHREFLHEGSDDPRRRFAESLLDATGGAGSVIVYGSHEGTCLRDLEAALHDLAPRLAQLRGRLFNLPPVIKTHVYDPDPSFFDRDAWAKREQSAFGRLFWTFRGICPVCRKIVHVYDDPPVHCGQPLIHVVERSDSTQRRKRPRRRRDSKGP